MKGSRFALAGLMLLAPAAIAAQEATIDVADAQVATAVVDRQPQGAATTFAADVGELYFFTRITGASPGTQVQHVWFQGEEERARVPLDVGSRSWRTWSSKRILPEWTGDWRVEVQSTDGTVLEAVSFTVG